ncbi:short-chain dehydrogenase protein [Rutstroemia sp. NJR-2017a WRK4]|nr:short-chain dehydrogenase protein [Rutstroemia sp. NJR-2017a WRK4]
MGNILSQFYFIPAAPLTEKNCPDQSGRVFLVTGGYAGVGFELCRILYAHNATVWMAGRSSPKAEKAISTIKQESPESNGQVEFLQLDLSDLSTIKPAVQSFTAKQERIDVLMNNAGVMYPPKGSFDAQGNDLQIGTNCLGHYLLYQLLLPLLTKTASSSPKGSVRVGWAGSIAVHIASPRPQGVVLDQNGYPVDKGVTDNYGQSKVGNVFLAQECAKTTQETGVVHVAFNPGNLRTELQRHWTGVGAWITDKLFVYPAVYGAYTELWTAVAPEVTPEMSGAYIYPWGRFGGLPDRLVGTDTAAKFVEWCGKRTEAFA